MKVRNRKRCPCEGQTLDRLIQPVMLGLLARSPQNGYRVHAQISRMPAFKAHPPNAAGVYLHLRELERRGLLAGSLGPPARGPVSRRFRLTAAGRACLDRWAHTLERHVQCVAQIRALIEESRGKRGETSACACARASNARAKAGR
jgi:DNA-binding PadR family transcriptional regulator